MSLLFFMRLIKGLWTGDVVVISAEDAKFLWELDCFGISPSKDTRKTPINGTITLYEACYLLQHSDIQLDIQKDLKHKETDIITTQHICDFETFFTLLQEHKQIEYIRTLVYCKIKQLGWKVQSGINYGADFLLYKGSPEEEHAPFAVTIRKKQIGITWLDAIALNRVANTARKRLVIAQVDVETLDIRFLELSRWIPETIRGNIPENNSNSNNNTNDDVITNKKSDQSTKPKISN